MAAVQNERLTRAERMIEHAGQTRVPTLRHAGRVAHRLLFGRIVINIEVISSQRAEVEVVVPDLVAAEVLRVRRAGKHRREQPTGRKKTTDRSPLNNHGWSLKLKVG